ncbi:MAG: DUF2304 domain-containing protein [Kiritimatiellia bacterium]
MVGLIRLLLGLLAAWLFAFLIRRGRSGRLRWLPAAGGAAAAVTMLCFALDPPLIHALGRLGYLTRIRILMAVFSAVVLLVTFESIRVSRLRERYALLWVATGLFILAGAMVTHVLDFFCAILGMQYVTLVVVIVFGFQILVAFQYSIELSRFHEDRTRMAQKIALLEAGLEDLRTRMKAPGPSPREDSAGKTPPPPGA